MNFLLKGLIKMFSCRFLPRHSLLSVISFCNWKENFIPVGVQDKNLVITSTKLVWFLLCLEYWCIMILQLGKLSRTRSILLIFWRILVVFLDVQWDFFNSWLKIAIKIYRNVSSMGIYWTYHRSSPNKIFIYFWLQVKMRCLGVFCSNFLRDILT